MSKPTTAVALMGNQAMLEKFQASMAKVLPQHITPVRMTQVVNRMIRLNPRLGECTTESFANALLECSEMGLEPDGRMAHLIPYGKECKLIPDYKGLVQLAREAEGVADIQPIKIKQNDKYRWINGQAQHEIDPFSDRGDMIGAYTKLVFTNGHVRDSEPMNRVDAEKIMKGSQAWKYAEGVVKAPGSGKKDSPWHTHFESMWLKSVVRRDAKTFPMSNRLKLALDKDDEDFKGAKDITPEVKVSSRLDDVASAGEPEPEKKKAPQPPAKKEKPKAPPPEKKAPAPPKEEPTPPPADKPQHQEGPEPEDEGEIKPFNQMTRGEMQDYLQNIHDNRIAEDQRVDFLAIGLGHLDAGDWFDRMDDFGITKLEAVCNDIAAEFE